MFEFFGQLKNRHIVQWAIGYLAAAWVLLQVIELLADIFAWPDFYLRILTIALGFGFLAVLVLAWFHGEKGLQRVTRGEIGLLIVILIVAGLVFTRADLSDIGIGAKSGATKSLFAGKSTHRLTATSEFVSGPSWSPDGENFVYVSGLDQDAELWIRSADGQDTRLTDNNAEDAQPDWSPDGRSILFVSSRDQGGKLDRSVFFGYSLGGNIYRVPAFGGEAIKIIDDGYNPDWSPDGGAFVFDSSRQGSRRIWVAGADGNNARQISNDESDLATHTRPAWSPDGRWIVYERQEGSQSSTSALSLGSADGSRTISITDGGTRDLTPAWAGENSIVFASDLGGAINLWQIDIDLENGRAIGEPVQLTLGAGEDIDPAVSQDGKLAYATLRRLRNLWSVSVDPKTWAVTSDPERVLDASWNDFAPALSTDKTKLAFSTDRTGNTDIWLYDGSSEPKPLTVAGGQDLQPVWSPDDRTIAFFSDANGNNDIWVIPGTGGAAVPITADAADDINPYWSADGSKIGFMSDRSGQSEVWIMDPDGSNPKRLTDTSAMGHTARWSPDGNWLLYTSLSTGDREIWAVRNDGAETIRLTDLATQDAHGLWSPDGAHFLYLSDHQKLFVKGFPDGEAQKIFDLGETIDYTHLSDDGTVLLFTREKFESDLWSME